MHVSDYLQSRAFAGPGQKETIERLFTDLLQVILLAGSGVEIDYDTDTGEFTFSAETEARRIAIQYPVGDMTTALTTGTSKATFRLPFAITVEYVRASLATASSSGAVTVDVNIGGTSIFGANKLSIDANEKTSTTAATAATFSETTLEDDAELTIDIDGAGTNAAGLVVYLVGTPAVDAIERLMEDGTVRLMEDGTTRILETV